MSGGEPLPAGRELSLVQTGNSGNLGCCRRSSQLDEAPVGQVARCDVILIYPRSGSLEWPVASERNGTSGTASGSYSTGSPCSAPGEHFDDPSAPHWTSCGSGGLSWPSSEMGGKWERVLLTSALICFGVLGCGRLDLPRWLSTEVTASRMHSWGSRGRRFKSGRPDRFFERLYPESGTKLP